MCVVLLLRLFSCAVFFVCVRVIYVVVVGFVCLVVSLRLFSSAVFDLICVVCVFVVRVCARVCVCVCVCVCCCCFVCLLFLFRVCLVLPSFVIKYFSVVSVVVCVVLFC